ncbi:Fatty-acid amide hydrolase 1 [Neolecta irregularis DAH-3]|uniref:Fatty-acid amide hydrolase 1 n=1 Tax=Neolecta irregularis (strain DAH-3) TaxID=1198029 RepID=A0A1U7LHP8_NEOID|nr:Fatty-acid amide hydrolase 1 [Neolecta irregularis DAH-3]|eukprot:OLL22051.1 Fatty-acid amide hydrolase 1 [Neolecta irregularis DAH-3]
MPIPAIPHNETANILPVAASTFLYNVLDYAVGSVPVTRVTEKDTTSAAYDSWKGVVHWYMYKIYDAKKMSGLPVGVQVVGRVLEEEKVVGMMKIVDSALRVQGREKS